MILKRKLLASIMIFFLLVTMCSCNGKRVKDPLNGHSNVQVYLETDDGAYYFSLDGDMQLMSGELTGDDGNWADLKAKDNTLEPPSHFSQSYYSEFPEQLFKELKDNMIALEKEKSQFSTYNEWIVSVKDDEYTRYYLWIDGEGYYYQPDAYNNYLLYNLVKAIAMGTPVDYGSYHFADGNDRVNLQAEVSFDDDLKTKVISYDLHSFFDKCRKTQNLYVGDSSAIDEFGENLVYQKGNTLFSYNLTSGVEQIVSSDCKKVVFWGAEYYVLDNAGNVYRGACDKSLEIVITGVSNFWRCQSYYRLPETYTFCYEQDGKLYFTSDKFEQKVVLDVPLMNIVSVDIYNDKAIILDDSGKIYYFNEDGKIQKSFDIDAKKVYLAGRDSFFVLQKNNNLVWWETDEDIDQSLIVAKNVESIARNSGILFILKKDESLEKIFLTKYRVTIGTLLFGDCIVREKLPKVDRLYGVTGYGVPIVQVGGDLYY